jgi:hypothetical protein
LVRLGWADWEIHALLKGTDTATVDREINNARNNKVDKMDRE